MQSVAIVTGASSGIGKATALRLSRDFPAIVLVARNAAQLTDVGEQVGKLGAQSLIIDIDLSLPTAAATIVRETLARFGRIDAVFNIAGAVPALDVFQMDDPQWESALALKFHGGRRLTIAAWDALKASRGAVVFISGNAAEIPKASAAAVGSINAAIEALAKAFAGRGIDDGVQVNCVSPGAVMTGRRLAMLEKMAATNGISMDDVQQRFLKQAGVSRFGQPEEVAALLAFVVSREAQWMTGSVLRIDGGEVKSV